MKTMKLSYEMIMNDFEVDFLKSTHANSKVPTCKDFTLSWYDLAAISSIHCVG